MTRSTWLSLAVAASLAIALPGAASAAAGCCQYRDSCKKTDDADACTDAGGIHYQLGVCDGKTCQPTASGGPIDGVPIGHQAVAWPALPAAATGQPQASSAGFDCVTKAGDFCWGELGKGNQCVSSTTCTPTQLAECLPGFPMCPKVEPAPGPTPYPEY